MDAFLRLPHGRLVVLGEPGAGKSVLAVLLTLGLLQHRQILSPEERERAPVPVLLPMASWNPQAEGLELFLARRLGQEYPRLRRQAGEGEPDLSAALVADRRILPILDGLDELPTPLHARAVGELNAYAGTGQGLVVTCRSREYEQAISTRGAELARAAVVELQPVALEQVIAFLSQPAIARPRWKPAGKAKAQVRRQARQRRFLRNPRHRPAVGWPVRSTRGRPRREASAFRHLGEGGKPRRRARCAAG
ncbi:NACHT domain-containing protein [Sphaerisporangium perillae]|uniref:NACHT domain-containing protein n=1 Tax=Sphaerisporangium perillae TaxID=2935860 RepID=UPI00200BE7A7|nr:NACHT domain-containing protein [Sphaerisporangium perillae]